MATDKIQMYMATTEGDKDKYPITKVEYITSESKGSLFTILDGKVDKDGTKVLSDVNFTTAMNTKLGGIADNATKNTIKVNGTQVTDAQIYAPSVTGTLGQAVFADENGNAVWQDVASSVHLKAPMKGSDMQVLTTMEHGDLVYCTEATTSGTPEFKASTYYIYINEGGTKGWYSLGAAVSLDAYQLKKVESSGVGHAMMTGADGNIGVSTVLATELGCLSGVTSGIQSQFATVNSNINNKVTSNTAITAGTNCKITYDAKGLVTGGSGLEVADIPELTTSKISGLDATLNGKQDVMSGGTGISITDNKVINVDNTVLTNSNIDFPSGKNPNTWIAYLTVKGEAPYYSESQFSFVEGITASMLKTALTGYGESGDSILTKLGNKQDKALVTAFQSTPDDTHYPSEKLVKTSLDGKVASNTAITGATKCKITYDSKGLVTAGADLTASDIPALATSKITGLDTALAGKATTGNLTDGSVTKVGTGTVGATTQLMYLNAGAPTAGITFSKGTTDPTGGSDGDVYFQYE